MQVSVETLNGLERKVTVSVPTEKVDEEVSSRLRNLAKKVDIKGFRPGKVPFDLVKKRYQDSVLQEVARELVQSTLFEALKEKELTPAGYPTVDPEQIESGKDFRYSAVFEVFPEFEIQELTKEDKLELIKATVEDSDVESMLKKLQEQNIQWHEVDRALAKGDKAIIDFEGFLGDEPFSGGKADDFEVVLGSGSMIPGFEEGLEGKEKEQAFELPVNFPETYQHKDLAGKEARFNITIKQVFEGQLPALDDDFAKKFNIEEGGIEALKKDIKDNMSRELERRVNNLNREQAFDELMKKNVFDLPMALINQEIDHLKHEMYHRIFGPEHKENEKIPDFPREIFEEQATRRVHLGLLFNEYVKKHEIAANQERVDAMIDKLATAYEKPEELKSYYQGNKERLADIQALVTEEVVAEKIMDHAEVVEKIMDYESVMNPKQDNNETQEKGA